MSNGTRKPGGFVEQVVYVPSRLWARVEDICEQSAKEPSEVIADALRLMMSGGVPAAPASVGGTVAAAPVESDDAPAAVDSASAEDLLAEVAGEPRSSAELRTRLEEIMTGVEERDSFINRHSVTVAELARKLSEQLELGDDDAECIELAALVHDIGKLRVPETVLNKSGKLTPEEWALVKQYPEFGAEILGDFDNLGEVAPLVRSHQERWDGSGYPDGLAGDDIPLGAQIVGICDVYNVLTSERAYRPALSPEIARRTIESGEGRLWKPDLGRALLDKVLRE